MTDDTKPSLYKQLTDPVKRRKEMLEAPSESQAPGPIIISCPGCGMSRGLVYKGQIGLLDGNPDYEGTHQYMLAEYECTAGEGCEVETFYVQLEKVRSEVVE